MVCPRLTCLRLRSADYYNLFVVGIDEFGQAYNGYHRQVNALISPCGCESMLTFIHRSGEFAPCPNHLAITEGPGVKGAWVEAAPHLIIGEVALWASVAGVKPTRIPGYWYDKPGADIPIGQKPMPGEKVILCLHGGGYTLLSAHPNDSVGVIIRKIIQHCQPVQRAFALEYRLSSTDPLPSANSFPAALIDAIAGYNYLVNTVGFDPSDIVIEGDSAGGNLTLALTRYLVEHRDQPEIPAPPSGLILNSPWADLSNSHDGPDSSLTINANVDYLFDMNTMRGLWSRQSFVGPHGLDAAASNCYISPACKSITTSFKGFPRTFISAGGVETLYDCIVTLKNRMAADMGEGDGDGQVTFYEAPDAAHDYLALSWFEPERTETLQAIGKWL
jgi:acetyl esterase/lipase